MTVHELWGKLICADKGEGFDLLYVEEAQEYIAEWAEDFEGCQVSVRYWTSTVKAKPDEMRRGAVEQMPGSVDVAGIEHCYSEITGFLWTEQDFVVGGHDMIEELGSHVDEYLLLEVEVHETP